MRNLYSRMITLLIIEELIYKLKNNKTKRIYLLISTLRNTLLQI